MKMRLVFIVSFLFLGQVPWSFALEKGKISGCMFGDAYWVAANHQKALKDQNGFWFRRIFLTYDTPVSDVFDVRFRVELNSPGDFKSSSKLQPVLKDGYLRFKHSGHQILFGLSPTPLWDVVEKIWGYRSVEKTPLDLQKFGSSRDFGLAFKGSLDSGKRVNYHIMAANGASNKSETNKGKKIMASLAFKSADVFTFELYSDYEGRPGDTDRYTFQAFAACHGRAGRLGIQYAHQVRKGTPDLELDIASVFGAVKLSGKAEWFARFDRMFDPNPEGAEIAYIPFDPTARSNFFLTGMDFSLQKNVHIIPNIGIVSYDDAGGKSVDTDVIARVTFYYRF